MVKEEKYTKENIKKKIVEIIEKTKPTNSTTKNALIYKIFYKELGIFEDAINELMEENIIKSDGGYVFTDEYYLRNYTNYYEEKKKK